MGCVQVKKKDTEQQFIEKNENNNQNNTKIETKKEQNPFQIENFNRNQQRQCNNQKQAKPKKNVNQFLKKNKSQSLHIDHNHHNPQPNFVPSRDICTKLKISRFSSTSIVKQIDDKKLELLKTLASSKDVTLFNSFLLKEMSRKSSTSIKQPQNTSFFSLNNTQNYDIQIQNNEECKEECITPKRYNSNHILEKQYVENIEDSQIVFNLCTNESCKKNSIEFVQQQEIQV